MKEKLNQWLANRYAVIFVLLIATLLAQADRNFGYFFGLFVVLYLAWQSRWDWSIFGFATRISVATLAWSLFYTLILFVGLSVVEAYLQHVFGAFDLSSLDDLRGNAESFLITLVIMWIFAAFGEELLFRGYYQQRFAQLLGDTTAAHWLAALAVAIYFGASHAYQGMAGMLSVGLAGLFYGLLFLFHPRNLGLVALVHGFYDTLGLGLIFLDQYDAFYIRLYEVLSGI